MTGLHMTRPGGRRSRVILSPDETPKNGVKPYDVNSYSRFGDRAFGSFSTMDFAMVGLGEPSPIVF